MSHSWFCSGSRPDPCSVWPVPAERDRRKDLLVPFGGGLPDGRVLLSSDRSLQYVSVNGSADAGNRLQEKRSDPEFPDPEALKHTWDPGGSWNLSAAAVCDRRRSGG